jgi:hypothetical protein
MKTLTSLSFLLFFGVTLVAQQMPTTTEYAELRKLRYDDDEWEFADRSGFTFGLNLGAYFGNKQSAMFYNGNALWELNDPLAQIYTIEERLTLNQLTQQQVQNLIAAEGFTIPFDAAPGNMRYNPGIMFGFRIGYRFNSDNGIFLDANYATLKAADKFTLRTNLLPDPMQGTEDIRLYNIIGEEDRLNLNLGYRTGLMINEQTNWYFETGASMLAVRMVDNYLEIEGNTFDLWLSFQGPNFFQGPVSNLTGTGFGYYVGTGVEVFFNETYEINLGLRMNRDRVIMGGFEAWNPRTGEPRNRINNWSFFVSFTL